MYFDGKKDKSSDTTELLEITLDKKIYSKQHITANNKTKSIFRIKKSLTLDKRKY